MNNTQIGAEPYSDRLYPTHKTKVGICNLCICFLSWGYPLVQSFPSQLWLVNLSWFYHVLSPVPKLWLVKDFPGVSPQHSPCFLLQPISWRLPIAQLRALGLNMLYQLAAQIRSPFSRIVGLFGGCIRVYSNYIRAYIYIYTYIHNGTYIYIHIHTQTLFPETWISPVASVRAILHLIFLGAISSSFWLGSRTWITLDPDPEMPGGLNGKPGGSIHRSSSKIRFFFLFSCEFLQHRCGNILGFHFRRKRHAKTHHRIGWWENLQESPIFDGKNHGFL